MQFEVIHNGINYYIGGSNQIPISNIGKLIKGLREYGPYQIPPLKHKNIALVYLNQADWQHVVGKMKALIINKLNDIWHVSNINFEDFTYDSSDFNSIKELVDRVIDKGVDGIMVILPGYMPITYYKLKSYLINNVPSQFMRHDILSNRNLEFYIDNLLVQFISKLGGKPWILNIDPERGSDIIIGTGATRIDNENLFCFALVFKRDGTMVWNEVSPIVRKDQYLNTLRKTLGKAVNDFKANNPNWNVEKLTLHVSGKRPKIRDGETKVLEESIEEFKQRNLISQNAKFVILHINGTHPYWIMGNYGFHPHEGTKIKMNSKRYLLALSQPPSQWNKRLKRYIPKPTIPIKPISVEIVSHNWTSDEFYPLAHEVLSEIYYLSKMNWRGFIGRNLPVTINYPKLVAKIIANMNRYDGYSINTGSNRLLQILPWFL